MFSPVEAFLMLLLMVMFSPVDAFFLLSYTGMVYVLSCRGFLVIIVNSDGVCSLLYRLVLMLSYTVMVYVPLL